MDWITQRTFQNWVIGVLVVLNVGVLAVVWIQSERRSPPPPREQRSAPGVSVQLLQQELGLSPSQVAQYEKLRTDQMDVMKAVNDELDSLKVRLVDDMFDPPPQTGSLDSAVSRIAALQARLEMLRFKHFSALVQVCTPEQRDRLHPILKEALGKRGPAGPPPSRNESEPVSRPGWEKKRRPAVGQDAAGNHPDREQAGHTRGNQNPPDRLPEPRPADRPGPPSLEEKLDRYTQRLSLTPEQRISVEAILHATREKEDSFKAQTNPTREAFEREKVRLRILEDDTILRLLTDGQKSEFQKMRAKRATPRPDR